MLIALYGDRVDFVGMSSRGRWGLPCCSLIAVPGQSTLPKVSHVVCLGFISGWAWVRAALSRSHPACELPESESLGRSEENISEALGLFISIQFSKHTKETDLNLMLPCKIIMNFVSELNQRESNSRRTSF